MTDTQLIVMLAAALGGLLLLCLGVALVACYFGDRSGGRKRSAAVTPASRRVDLRKATRVVSVGPSRHNLRELDDGWAGDQVSDDGNPAMVAAAPVQSATPKRSGAIRAARVVPSGAGAYVSGEGDEEGKGSSRKHKLKRKHKHKHKRKHKHRHDSDGGDGEDGGSRRSAVDGSRELLELEGSVSGSGRVRDPRTSAASLRQPPHVHPAAQDRSSSRRLQPQPSSRSVRSHRDHDRSRDDVYGSSDRVVLGQDAGREHVRNSQRMQRMM